MRNCLKRSNNDDFVHIVVVLDENSNESYGALMVSNLEIEENWVGTQITLITCVQENNILKI